MNRACPFGRLRNAVSVYFSMRKCEAGGPATVRHVFGEKCRLEERDERRQSEWTEQRRYEDDIRYKSRGDVEFEGEDSGNNCRRHRRQYDTGLPRGAGQAQH